MATTKTSLLSGNLSLIYMYYYIEQSFFFTLECASDFFQCTIPVKENLNTHLHNKCLLIDHTLDNQDLWNEKQGASTHKANADADTQVKVPKCLSYLIRHSHHFTHLQVLHRRTQVSDWTKSQTAVTLVMKATEDISDSTMKEYYKQEVRFSTISEMNQVQGKMGWRVYDLINLSNIRLVWRTLNMYTGIIFTVYLEQISDILKSSTNQIRFI